MQRVIAITFFSKNLCYPRYTSCIISLPILHFFYHAFDNLPCTKHNFRCVPFQMKRLLTISVHRVVGIHTTYRQPQTAAVFSYIFIYYNNNMKQYEYHATYIPELVFYYIMWYSVFMYNIIIFYKLQWRRCTLTCVVIWL